MDSGWKPLLSGGRWPNLMPGPKPLSERAYRHQVAFRSDQEHKVRELAGQRLLSKVCQRAVDAVYEDKP